MRHSLTGNISAPSPIGNGWQSEDGELTVTWMTTNPAPVSVLQMTLIKAWVIEVDICRYYLFATDIQNE